VPTSNKLIGSGNKEEYALSIKQEYDKLRKDHLSRTKSKEYVSLKVAKDNAVPIQWNDYIPPKPSFIGNKTFSKYSLEEIRNYIDWTPFFSTWMLKGKFPAILEDKKYGKEAQRVYDDANDLLDQILRDKSLTLNGVIGMYPANSFGDDIEIYSDDVKTRIVDEFHFLRQQGKKANGVPNLSLADFIIPEESGRVDYLGFFAVTSGHGIESLVTDFEKAHDDYNAIMVKAIADRLAEAFAELLHKKVRTEYWGYSKSESLTYENLIKEQYQGIRPAPGYPACPDHTEKTRIFKLLNTEEETGITLTESMAMYPAASVSGYYFSHPESRYFPVGKISKDQVDDYARRKGMSVKRMEKWLAPNLNY